MMSRADELLIAQIEAGTQTTRALLCALARRGKALRQAEPDRAERLLGAFRSHPSYKAARVAFDLLELEDLMLDGPAPTRVDGYFETDSVAALARIFTRLQAAVDSHADPGPGPGPASQAAQGFAHAAGVTLAPEPAPPGGWPELSAAEYLYDLVILGVLRQLSRVAAAKAASDALAR